MISALRLAIEQPIGDTQPDPGRPGGGIAGDLSIAEHRRVMSAVVPLAVGGRGCGSGPRPGRRRRAGFDIRRSRNSQMDGFAVRAPTSPVRGHHQTVCGWSHHRRRRHRIGRSGPGEAIRIMTGGAIPVADAVVKVEDTTIGGRSRSCCVTRRARPLSSCVHWRGSARRRARARAAGRRPSGRRRARRVAQATGGAACACVPRRGARDRRRAGRRARTSARPRTDPQLVHARRRGGGRRRRRGGVPDRARHAGTRCATPSRPATSTQLLSTGGVSVGGFRLREGRSWTNRARAPLLAGGASPANRSPSPRRGRGNYSRPAGKSRVVAGVLRPLRHRPSGALGMHDDVRADGGRRDGDNGAPRRGLCDWSVARCARTEIACSRRRPGRSAPARCARCRSPDCLR